jgi:hypothetical protein
VFLVDRTRVPAARAKPTPNADIMWSWFQLNAGRAIGARNDIQRFGVPTSQLNESSVVSSRTCLGAEINLLTP